MAAAAVCAAYKRAAGDAVEEPEEAAAPASGRPIEGDCPICFDDLVPGGTTPQVRHIIPSVMNDEIIDQSRAFSTVMILSGLQMKHWCRSLTSSKSLSPCLEHWCPLCIPTSRHGSAREPILPGIMTRICGVKILLTLQLLTLPKIATTNALPLRCADEGGDLRHLRQPRARRVLQKVDGAEEVSPPERHLCLLQSPLARGTRGCRW